MAPKPIRQFFNLCIITAAICSGVWLYNTFGPHLSKVDCICLAIESVFSPIIIVLALTKKKWDKQDSDQVEK